MSRSTSMRSLMSFHMRSVSCGESALFSPGSLFSLPGMPSPESSPWSRFSPVARPPLACCSSPSPSSGRGSSSLPPGASPMSGFSPPEPSSWVSPPEPELISGGLYQMRWSSA